VCSLCGVIAGHGHWSDSDNASAAFAARAGTHTRLRERQDRLRLLNAVLRHYGLRLADWSGNAYVLSSHTGRTAIIDNLGQLWTEAERLSGRICDPLEDKLLSALQEG
jgi:hypothetical protein